MVEGTISRAAILETLGMPLVIDEIRIPALDYGQVLVRVHCSGVCGTQIGEQMGERGTDPYLPHLLGHEGGGVVAAIGSGVTRVGIGDRVVMHWRKGAGIEANCPMYNRKDGEVGAGQVTTFNERAIISENRLTRIEEDIPFDIAALMGCCVTTGLGLVNNEAQLKIGQSIAVLGAGGVGLNVIQGAAMVSAAPIIAIDKNDFKRELARACGATVILDPTLGPLQEDILNTVGPEGVDVFVECTGDPDLIAQAYRLTSSTGRTIMVGLPRFNKSVTFELMQSNLSKTLLWSQGGLTNPTEDIPRYLKLYREKKLKLDHLITHRFKLEEANEALAMVMSGTCGKCVLEMK